MSAAPRSLVQDKQGPKSKRVSMPRPGECVLSTPRRHPSRRALLFVDLRLRRIGMSWLATTVRRRVFFVTLAFSAGGAALLIPADASA